MNEWQRRDLNAVWHPFTQMKELEEYPPVVIERGEGVYLYDTEGTRYYDGVSSLWVNVHGHRDPDLNEALTDQLDRVAHSTLLGQGNTAAVELAEDLVYAAPEGLNRVYYSDSGATAVEIGMKMALQYYANRSGEPAPRPRFLTFENGYHGDTFGPMSIVPDETFHWPFDQLLPDPVQVPFPHPRTWPEEDVDDGDLLDRCMERVDAALENHPDEIAGVITEPVQGAGGMIPAPEGFLLELRRLSRRHEVLLMVDEVATGFGRTGPLFACLKEGITPDILTLGKGLTGGYLPVAATLATESIYEQFLGQRREALLHGHSYTGNALGCAVARASLRKLQEMLPRLPDRIDTIRRGLDPLRGHEGVAGVRQAGFMCGIEVPDPRETLPAHRERLSWRICFEALERGMLLRPLGDVVVFMPPQASSTDQLDKMTDILVKSVRSVVSR